MAGGVPGKIEFIHSGFEEFFEEVKRKYYDSLPVHEGELYLEFHRGSFITGSWLKRLNRRNEELILAVEKLYSLLKVLGGDYPKEELDSVWKNILLNQDHAMMTSTVCRETFMIGLRRAIKTNLLLRKLAERGMRELAEGAGDRYLVFNPNGWEVSTYLRVSEPVSGPKQTLSSGESLVYVGSIPPLGFKSVSSFDEPGDEVLLREDGDSYVLENKFLRVRVSKKTGWVVEIFDKLRGYNVLRRPTRLRVYADYPTPGRGTCAMGVAFDAWEVYHRQWLNRPLRKDLKAKDVRAGERGRLFCSVLSEFEFQQFVLRRLRRFRSKFLVEVGLYAGKPYVEIRIRAYWRAWHRLVKLVVPLAVRSEEAVFEIPYGALARRDIARAKSRTERAKYEVPGLRWVDVSDGRRGVAIIDDSRYGYTWEGGTIELSLLRAPTFPDIATHGPSIEKDKLIQRLFVDYRLCKFTNRFARTMLELAYLLLLMVGQTRIEGGYGPMDQGGHEITVWIYPHAGNYWEGEVPKVASELNAEYFFAKGAGEATQDAKWLARAEPEGIVQLTAVKLAEDDPNALVFRLFNASEESVEAKILFGFQPASVREANLLEEPMRELGLDGRELRVRMAPHEVKTIVVGLKSQQG